MTGPTPLELAERERTYRAIGRFIFEFSQLEYTLRHHVGELADVQEEFFDILTSSFDFARLCKALLALSAMKNDGTPDPTLKRLINDCQKINEDRVRVVHGLWVFGTEHGRAIHTARDSMKSKDHFEKPGDLDAQSDRIQKLRWEIDRAIHDIWFSAGFPRGTPVALGRSPAGDRAPLSGRTFLSESRVAVGLEFRYLRPRQLEGATQWTRTS